MASGRLNHRRDGRNRIPFQPVVDVDKSFALRPCGLPLRDHFPASRTRLRVFLLDAVVRLERLYRLLILATRLEQESGGNQLGVGAAARQSHLLANRRHRVPAIVNVRDLMPGEALEVLRL